MPDAQQAAVHVVVSYDFKAGCIAVLAQDKAAPDKQAKDQEPVLDRAPVEAGTRNRKADFGVFRKDDWGRDLVITVTAHEQTCEGPEVARQVKEFTLDKAGTQTLPVSLTAADADDDGYVAQAGGGSDCNDGNLAIRPGQTELCDGVDNDCRNGADDGLTLSDFFLDGDGDGAGAGPAVKACSAPANHVTSNTDCDDSTSARTPGKAEVCDEVDNNCNTTVDEGLPTSTFHRDADGDGVGVAGNTMVKCRAPVGYVPPTAAFDCDDTKPAVKPGATEVCNNIDDNCVSGIDEGFTKNWYRDADLDGYGLQSNMQTNCVQPSGFVSDALGFDCNDTLAAVNPGATEVCNNRDDNCVGGADENFPTKGNTCTNDTCDGQVVCKADGSGTECNAGPPVSFFPDVDGDGEGQSSAVAQKVCDGSFPPGKVINSTDCDDRDPHNRGAGSEVCDDRDNNCANGKTDEAAVCGGKGWKQLTDAVVTGRNWTAVAVGDGGYPVWLAGESGALAFRTGDGDPFTNRFQRCGPTTWRAAWVRPSDGQLFVVGDGGNIATLNVTTPTGGCTPVSTQSATGGTTSGNPLVGVVGFESGPTTTIYAVNDLGHVYEWVAGMGAPAFKISRGGQPFGAIHGRTASQLILGGIGNGGLPTIETYNPTIGASVLVDHQVTGVNNANKGVVLGISGWDNTHAYSSGEKGQLLRWDGNTTWNFASPNGAMVVDLPGVVAFDDYSVYVASADGKIRRAAATGWVEHFSATGALRDIAAASRRDIWAVGPSGVVVHFPEQLP